MNIARVLILIIALLGACSKAPVPTALDQEDEANRFISTLQGTDACSEPADDLRKLWMAAGNMPKGWPATAIQKYTTCCQSNPFATTFADVCAGMKRCETSNCNGTSQVTSGTTPATGTEPNPSPNPVVPVGKLTDIGKCDGCSLHRCLEAPNVNYQAKICPVEYAGLKCKGDGRKWRCDVP